MKILQELDQGLLERKQILLEIEDKGSTPSEDYVRKKVASQVKAGEDCIAIQKIHSVYGGGKFRILAHVYKDAKQLNKIENFNKKKKNNKEKQAQPQQKEEKKEGENSIDNKVEEQGKKDGGEETGKKQESK